MRILYILSSYPNYSESFIHNEIASLNKQGHHIGVLSLRDKPYHGNDTCDYLKNTSSPITLTRSIIKSAGLNMGFIKAALRYPNQRLKYVYLAASSSYILKLIRSFNPDIVISHFLFTGTLAASKLCQRLKIPIHIRLHTNYSSLTELDARCVLENANSISAISTKLAQETARKYSVKRDIRVIRQDVDLTSLDGIEVPESDKLANQYIAIGRLVPKKGFVNLIEAFSMLESHLKLEIYGDGPLEHELKSKIESLGLENRIMLKGKLAHDQLMPKLKTARALIVPSIDDNGNEDGIPTVIAEAMALRTVVLSSEIGAISELIKDKETGYILNSSNPNSLAQSLVEAISDFKNWPEILEQANKKVILEYSRKINIDDIR